MESHILHGYLKRCPEIAWDESLKLYRCGLSGQESFRRLLGLGEGCCAPLNPWRTDVRNRDND